MISSYPFNSANDFFVEQFLAKQPPCTADRRQDKVHLSYSGDAGWFCARPRAVFIPGRANLCSVLFDSDFAQRTYVPKRAVNSIPKKCFRTTTPVGFCVCEFERRSLGVVLDLDVLR